MGTTQDEVQRWIDEGLLPIFRQEPFPSNQPSGSVPPEIKVDEDELLELAETIGWLRLSAVAWDEAEGDQ